MALLDNPGGSDENRIATLPQAGTAGNEIAPVNQGVSTGQTNNPPSKLRSGQIPPPDARVMPPASTWSAPMAPPTATQEPTATPTPTATLVPTATPVAAPAPEPTATPMPTATLAPTVTPVPAAPAPTRSPTEWLIQHPAHPKITGAKAETSMLLQGCYLGSRTAARKFRLASWDVWDPSRYGSELKFVKIITNNGEQLPLERGACYEARGEKHVDSDEEYVCLDRNATHPQQSPCDNYRENEVMPTFILYPDRADEPENFADSFVLIRKPPSE